MGENWKELPPLANSVGAFPHVVSTSAREQVSGTALASVRWRLSSTAQLTAYPDSPSTSAVARSSRSVNVRRTAQSRR